MKTPYFPFYPQDWLSDPKVAQLTYEERGIYFDLLCRMWSFADGTCSLPNDDSFICRILNLRPAKWKKVKSILVHSVAPVFYIENNRILNKRLQKEFATAKKKSENNSASIKKRWRDNHSKSLNNKESENTNVSETNYNTRAQSDTDTDIFISSDINIYSCSERSNRSSPKIDESPRAITIPLNNKTEFIVTETMVTEFEQLYPAVEVRQALRSIRAWSLSNPTKRKTKSGILRHINQWLAKEQNTGGTPNEACKSDRAGSRSHVTDWQKANAALGNLNQRIFSAELDED